jgi:hypothetical protein
VQLSYTFSNFRPLTCVESDIYQKLCWYSWFSWWWARGCSKHVEDWNKQITYKKKELYVKLVIYQNCLTSVTQCVHANTKPSEPKFTYQTMNPPPPQKSHLLDQISPTVCCEGWLMFALKPSWLMSIDLMMRHIWSS